ncbi:hypothetical protein BG011_006477 [Mortierella polycephala]|uniref:Uncharacterized protein n=1 Tax=Mortierella polycephala TaxID=41804 RepID=A0A9P6PW46_9FUNG|nr:hypothetical protein BG011_006477 [Mortierella polycephala]
MDSTVPQAHVDWLKENISSDCAITMPEFALKFEYFTKNDAEEAFSALISKSFIAKTVKRSLSTKYETWKRNEGDNFWATRVVKISKTRTAIELVAGSVPVAKEMIWEDTTSSAALPTIQPNDSGDRTEYQSSSFLEGEEITAGKLHRSFYDPKNPFLDTSKSASSPKATPTEAELDDVQVRSDARAGKRGRMNSGTSWLVDGEASVNSSKHIKDPTKDSESHDNSRATSTSSGETITAGELEFPDPTANLEQFVALNQEVEWIVEEEDLIRKFREFRAQNLQDFSLARDGIADMTINSKFRRSLAPNVGRAASRMDPVSNLREHWPTLTDVLERVFAKSHYDSVSDAIAEESMRDPVVRYIMSIIHSYSHYFSFHDAVPTNVNERQGFADLTWCFIRGAMTMTGLETQYLEVLITGVQERKNWARNDLIDAKQIGQFADGVTIWEGSQLCLSEASTIHNGKAEKLRQDEFKLARAMRDSWVSQVKATSKHSIPRRGIAVYGSSTFNDETKLWRLDFRGVFRLLHFDTFFVPLKKTKEGILRSLILAMRIKAEVSAREEEAKPVDHEIREMLQEIVNSIQPTTSTPTKNYKKRPALFYP